MAKRKVKIKDIKRDHIRISLLSNFHFLKNKYRPLKENELKSSKVFIELFGEDEPIDFTKLNAIYEYQK